MSGARVAHDKPPRPRIKPLRWPILLIWIVPIAAAVTAGIYYLDYRHENAREIVIRFSDADGLKPGQTPVMHLGVDLGKVTSVELTADHSAALVHMQLNQSSLAFAQGGTEFWIERAEISAGNISGLTTVVSGPYVDGIPGDGPPQTQFIGLDQKPLASGDGLRVYLYASRLQHVQRNSSVYYRGIQVGLVQGVELNPDASGVRINLFIWPRYSALVRANSEFWIESGIDISGGLFSGLKLNVESLRAILSGGVAFATPDDTAQAAAQGAEFPLNDSPKDQWLAWSGGIPIPPDNSQDQDKERSADTQALQAVRQATQH
ncbi:MAG TPA: MlaD family protein [Tepidisphaeraceae bacterium]|nr:MlaD family protein [Tepidisphaeraceae bacterium]